MLLLLLLQPHFGLSDGTARVMCDWVSTVTVWCAAGKSAVQFGDATDPTSDGGTENSTG